MAKESGINVVLEIDDTELGVFVKLPGQVDTQFAGSSVIADTTDKDGAWVTGLNVAISGEVTGQVVNLGNLQLAYIEAQWLAQAPVIAQIKLDAAGKGYGGNFHVANFSYNGPRQDATRVDFTLVPDAALTAFP